MQYRGYCGQVTYNDDDGVFHGEVLGVRDVVTFQGTSVRELRLAFRRSVEDYLAFCETRGEEPDKPFSGRLLLRISPELHRRLFLRARKSGQSLNGWIVSQLDRRIRQSQASQVR